MGSPYLGIMSFMTGAWERCEGFQKKRGLFSGFLIMRILVYWGLFWALLFMETSLFSPRIPVLPGGARGARPESRRALHSYSFFKFQTRRGSDNLLSAPPRLVFCGTSCLSHCSVAGSESPSASSQTQDRDLQNGS